MGELQIPSRLTRQLPQSCAPRTNQLGGVLQAPRATDDPGATGAPGAPGATSAPRATGAPGATGVPGAPIQTLTPPQQALHSSLTAFNNVRISETFKNPITSVGTTCQENLRILF